MKNTLKKTLAAVLAAAMMPVTGIMPIAPVSAAATGTLIRLDPSEASPFNNGKFEGWGTSLCWWANRLGYSEELTQQAADAFFSDEGLGLDIARYNLGGGDDPTHNHITRSDSKIPGYATGFDDEGNIIYDWTASATIPSASREITSALIGPSTILVISFTTSIKSLPSFAIKDGFVVTPQITPMSLHSLISATLAVSTNNFISKLPPNNM